MTELACAHRRRISPTVWATGLLLMHGILLAWGATLQSPISDEAASMVAGLRIWQTGQFDLYRVNPPLVRSITTAPVTLLIPPLDWSRQPIYETVRTEHAIGAQFIRSHGEAALHYFVLARWMCIPFNLLGGWICFRWAGSAYGPASGLIALTLWCFSPNLLAHGQLITTDAPAAATGVMAGYSFWRWCRKPSWCKATGAGLMLGVAELTKTIWIVAYLVYPTAWVIARWRRQSNCPDRGGQLLQLGFLLILSLIMINIGYLGGESFRPLGELRFVSRTLAATDSRTDGRRGGNRFSNTWVGAVRVPLPRHYVEGIDCQKYELERELWSYLRGEWRTEGWWFYYLYGLAVKVPLGIWGLAILAVVCRVHSPTAHDRSDICLLLLPLAVLVLVSSQTSMNHHVRYVLPGFPFVFIWCSRAGRVLQGRPADNHRAMSQPIEKTRFQRALATLVVLCMAWIITSCLFIFPHQLSYFNELAGGPRNGAAHLLGSNLDWGQDQIQLMRWLRQQDLTEPVELACLTRYFPTQPLAIARQGSEMRQVNTQSVQPNDARPVADRDGLRRASRGAHKPHRRHRMAPLPGIYAIRVNRLWGHGSRWSFFRQWKPVARAGYSIYIYRVSMEEANRQRRRLGLPAFSAPHQSQPPITQ